MSDELCELLAQYPDSQRLAISVGGEGVPIGLNVGELTVLLARSDALHASQARLSEAVKVLEEMTKGLDMVHNGLMDPTRPRQAVGEVCYRFLSKAKAFMATPGDIKP